MCILDHSRTNMIPNHCWVTKSSKMIWGCFCSNLIPGAIVVQLWQALDFTVDQQWDSFLCSSGFQQRKLYHADRWMDGQTDMDSHKVFAYPRAWKIFNNDIGRLVFWVPPHSHGVRVEEKRYVFEPRHCEMSGRLLVLVTHLWEDGDVALLFWMWWDVPASISNQTVDTAASHLTGRAIVVNYD